MKILYHHRTTAQDGSAVHINGLIDALRDCGSEVLVVAPSIAAAGVGEKGTPGWANALRRVLPQGVHEAMELAYNVPETSRLMRVARAFRPDVIYERSNLYLMSGAFVARRLEVPLLEEVNAPYFVERSVHSGIALPRVARWSERWALRRADAVISVTGVLSDMVAEVGVARERLHVMPNGVDRTLLAQSAADATAKERLGLGNRVVLGFTGFVREWNGLDRVLDHLASPQGRGSFLLVVGDGPARTSLEQRGRELGVSDRVRFTGVVRRPDVAGYVSAFDIALQPSANPYASPLKLFEYMALGRATVAPDQPNIREILTDNEDALLFDPTSDQSFGNAVACLASDAPLRNRLAAAARATLERRRLSWQHNATRVLELADELIRERSLRHTRSSHAQRRSA